MSATQEIPETHTEAWPDWQGTIINGAYPLRRILHGSDKSAVFLTDYTSGDTAAAAAIKIVPAERVTLAQLAHWRTAAALTHPHLMRLLDAGLYQLAGRQFLFVVMEYADQTLAQVLPKRALSCEEVRELLPPTLDALAYLHARNLVQGEMKPANFLVVDDQLKLASDGIRPAGEPRASSARPSLYDPPEARNGGFSQAGDIWGLGITLAEALTRCLPWPDEQPGTTCLPPTLPAAFADTIQRCLSHDPARRASAAELHAQFTGAHEAPVTDAPEAAPCAASASAAPPPPPPPQSVTAPPTSRGAAPPSPPARRSPVPAIAVSACLALLAVAWATLRLFHGHADSAQPVPGGTHPPAQSPAGAPAAAVQNPPALLPSPAQNAGAPGGAKAREVKQSPSRPGSSRASRPPPPAAEASPGVVHEQMPVVAHSALRTIHGHLKVTALVTVDHAGNVTGARLENPGPSAYFARSVREAAGKWQFAAADGQDARQWLLRFEFSSSGVTAHATPR